METSPPGEEIARSGARYRTLLEINNAVISNLTREALFHAIARALRRVVPFDRTAIFLHDPVKDVLRLFVLESTLPSDYFDVGFEVTPGESHVGWAFRHQRYLLRRDLDKERQYSAEDLALADGVRSYVVVPLIVRGRSIGALGVASATPNQYSEADAAFFQDAANQIALAVENMKAYEEVSTLNVTVAATAARHRTLLEINNAIISNLKREDLFHAIAQALRNVVQFDRAAIFLHDPEKDVLRLFVLESTLTTQHFVVGWEQASQDSPAGWVFRHRRPLVKGDLAQDRRHKADDLSYADGIRSYAILPLAGGGVAMGVLTVASTIPNRYADAEVEFLQEVANQVALAVENMKAYEEISALSRETARLYEEVKQEAGQRRRAEEMLRAITEGTASMTGSDFFYSLTRHAASAIQVRYAFVADCDDAKTRARTLAFWTGDRFGENFTFDLPPTPCAAVVRGEICHHARDLQRLFPDDRYLVEMGAESYLGVPIVGASGAVIGHLAVLDTKPMDETKPALPVLAIFAARAGAELERLRAEEELKRALAEVEALKNRLHAENVYLQEEIRGQHDLVEMVGSSAALLAVLRQVEHVAATSSTVLISGETGTGKELVARAIHSRSARRERPLVKVNCSAISAGLVESELFGHVKGAFTGAIERRVGRFELADGGTIFLDEVGDLPLDTQVKLLRVLQEQEFEPVGSSRTVRVSVRVIAATNRDLQEAVRTGPFRADLFYRLNVFPITVPPLRERRSDIPQLVMFFLSSLSKRLGKKVDAVPRETMDRLVNYPWPGNVRELQNVLERAVVLSQGPVLQLDRDLLPVAASGASSRIGASPPPVSQDSERAPPTSPPDLATLQETERNHIVTVLKQTGGVIEGPKGAAKILNLHPNTLRSRMKKLGIRRPHHEIS